MDKFNIIIWNCTAIVGFFVYGVTKDIGWLVGGINCTLASIVMLSYEKRIDLLKK